LTDSGPTTDKVETQSLLSCIVPRSIAGFVRSSAVARWSDLAIRCELFSNRFHRDYGAAILAAAGWGKFSATVRSTKKTRVVGSDLIRSSSSAGGSSMRNALAMRI
jgi:hypothetical protein